MPLLGSLSTPHPARNRCSSLSWQFLLSSIGLQVFNPEIIAASSMPQTGAATGVLINSALTFIALAILQQLVHRGAACW